MAHNINHLKTETSAGLDTSWKIKKPKNTNEGEAPNYGTMKNKKDGGGTNYFSMNYKANKNNAQDANTNSTFKDPEGIAMAGGTLGFNDGHMNYGTTPIDNHEPGHLSPEEVEKQSIGKKATGVGGNYGDRKLPGIKNIRIGKEYGNTDLLDVARGAYNKIKNYITKS